jgi:hypothetical protein
VQKLVFLIGLLWMEVVVRSHKYVLWWEDLECRFKRSSDEALGFVAGDHERGRVGSPASQNTGMSSESDGCRRLEKAYQRSKGITAFVNGTSAWLIEERMPTYKAARPTKMAEPPTMTNLVAINRYMYHTTPRHSGSPTSTR